MQTYKSLLRKLAHFQVKHPLLTVLIILSLTLVMIAGSQQVRTVASLELMMPETVEPIAAFNQLRDQGLGQDMVALVVSLDPGLPLYEISSTTNDLQDYFSHLDTNLRNNIDVIEVYGIHNSPQPQQFITPDGKSAVLLLSTDIGTDDERMKALVDDIQIFSQQGLPAGYDVSITGTPAIQQRLGELISADRKNTQLYSTLFVLVVLVLTFGTISSAVVPLLVVTTSVTWLYGTMGYTNLPISTLAGGVAAMVIGIGIDFAIHIINKFKYERKKGYGIKQSIELAVVHTGSSLTVTSATTIAAFLAFLSGIMPEMARFGILMSMGIGYALLFTLIGLPAALVLEEHIIKWLTKHTHFGVEGEYQLKK